MKSAGCLLRVALLFTAPVFVQEAKSLSQVLDAGAKSR